MSIYDYTVPTANGGELALANFKGKVMLIVNTATGCGFTPHYEALEKMYEKYHEQGLEIIDIPCNQFGNQAPGNDDEIHQFCTLHYNTKFPQMKKSDVNGDKALPLYAYLKTQQGFRGFGAHQHKDILEKMMAETDPGWKTSPDIKWNFTKFVADRQGNIVARFEPTADMQEVEKCIAALINETVSENKMSGIEKVYKFIDEAGTYYLATADGDQPRVRAFGTVLLYDGKIYIQTGKAKPVSRQIAANPKVEICAFKNGRWLRVAGKLVNDDNRDIKAAMLEKMPSLKPLYSPDDGNMQMLYFKNAKATFSSFAGEQEAINF